MKSNEQRQVSRGRRGSSEAKLALVGVGLVGRSETCGARRYRTRKPNRLCRGYCLSHMQYEAGA